ncbi:MAG TPA: DUF488 domain-containing protein [Terriglobales bacterium]|jgi:uncharacterized protein (DUF488 family)|nr:DUF488 domain-containing protein [Terriglobales bacterium]
MRETVFTIGHSNRTLQEFLALLVENELTAVADVRSQPYSRMNPQFNRESLAEFLGKHEIAYVFLGEELGARSRDPACYVDGKVQYDALARTKLFEHGLDRLEKGTLRYRLALMCAEKEPLACHRFILVARHLARRGFLLRHIIDPGVVEDHEASITRLLVELQMDSMHLFGTQDDLVELAYERQATRIAFSQGETVEAAKRESA